MDIANAFTVRRAQQADDATLWWLGALAGQDPVRRPALIADVDGMPAAAISLLDGRVVEFQAPPGWRHICAVHRSGWRPRADRDATRRHLRALIPFLVSA